FTYGYTQQLGGGFAATIAAQDVSGFQRNVVDVGGASFAFPPFLNGGIPNNNKEQNAGTLIPDIVGTIRVDQAWGGAQIAGAWHDVRARYFNESNFTNGLIAGYAHPSDRSGWAGMAGAELNLDQFWGGWFSKGDTFAIQSQYCVGAAFYCSNLNNGGAQY